MEKESKSNKSIFTYVFSTLIILWLWYLALPVINLYFWGLPILVLVYGVLILGFDLILKKYLNKIGVSLIIIGLIFTTVIPFFTSSSLLHASKYRDIIGEIKESKFTQDISPIDIDQIRLVDQEMAMRLGDKKLGEDPALGSQAELGDYNIQRVKDELYWVAPLLHRSFWKWKDNRAGTEGYVIVSASNPQNVRLVQKLGDKEIRIKYQPNAFFGEYLKRHLYLNGYMNIGLTDYTFEINEQGEPFWVVTLYQKEVGYGGNNAVGVLVVDAQTGEINKYEIDNAPSWVDRIQPEAFINSQLNDWGVYVKGWLNSLLAEEGVLKVTPGMSLVYGNDNNSYWYTGLTSSGSDESTIGFVLVNTRTKETKLYRQSGATELAAMSSAEGKVQEKNYTATFPIMYNILGVPTYVCSLKDKAGLVKLVAMISVEDYSLLGIGETKLDALRAYRSVLKSKGNAMKIDDTVSEVVLEGKILRISYDIKNGNSYYYFIIEGKKDKVFIASSQVSHEVPLTKAGDQVYIKYDQGESVVIDVVEFDNRNL